MCKLKWIDFNHVCNLFLLGNVSHDPHKVICNFSSYKLTEVEKSVLFKGLQFVLPTKRLEYADYMLPFELLFHDIKTNDLTTS